MLRRNALLNAKGVRVENQGPEVPLSALPIPILKLVLCGENREELENCRRCFPPELCCFTFSSRHFVDVVSGETGKARAMAELAERLEIPLSQCLCAGDGMSDLPMLKQAGVASRPTHRRRCGPPPTWLFRQRIQGEWLRLSCTGPAGFTKRCNIHKS